MPDSILEELGIIEVPSLNTGPFRGLVPDEVLAKYGPEEEFMILDKNWSKSAFFVSGASFEEDSFEAKNLYRSKADFTWEDTSPGGSVVINPRPQYTRYSDPRRRGTLPYRAKQSVSNIDANMGMGRQYAEYLHDGEEATYLRFGIIENNSLISFLANYGDPELTSIHTSGKHAPAFAEKITEAIAIGAVLKFTAWTAGLGWALVVGGVALTAKIVSIFIGSTTDFYSLKPMMFLYWLAVNNFVNAMLLEEGFLLEKKDGKVEGGIRKEIDKDHLSSLHDLYPEMFTLSGGIDTAAIMSKSSRRWQSASYKWSQLLGGDILPDVKGDPTDTTIPEFKDAKDAGAELGENGVVGELIVLFNKLTSSNEIAPKDPSPRKKTFASGDTELDTRLNELTEKRIRSTLTSSIQDDIKAKDNSYLDFLAAEYKLGSAYAVMRFDNMSGMGDSFSNSTTASSVAGMINSTSDKYRNISHDLGGVRTDAGVLKDFFQEAGGILGAIGSGLENAANTLTLNIPDAIARILKGTNAIIPEHWSESSVDIAEASYTMTLVSTSQHPIARIVDIIIPMAMCVAAVAPRQTGPNAYTGPFMVTAFTRGKSNIKMGIASSLRIEREVTNQAYDARGRPMAFKLTLGIKDLTPLAPMLMPSPVPSTTPLEEAKMMSGDSVFNRWIRTLAGRGIGDDLYLWQRSKKRRDTFYNVTANRMSAARRMMIISTSLDPGGTLNFYRSVDLNLRNAATGEIPAALTR